MVLFGFPRYNLQIYMSKKFIDYFKKTCLFWPLCTFLNLHWIVSFLKAVLLCGQTASKWCFCFFPLHHLLTPTTCRRATRADDPPSQHATCQATSFLSAASFFFPFLPTAVLSLSMSRCCCHCSPHKCVCALSAVFSSALTADLHTVLMWHR